MLSCQDIIFKKATQFKWQRKNDTKHLFLREFALLYVTHSIWFLSIRLLAQNLAGIMSWTEHVHFDKWVGVSVGVHGSQVSAAHHAHNQTTLLTVVHQRHQDTTPVLRVVRFIKLRTHVYASDIKNTSKLAAFHCTHPNDPLTCSRNSKDYRVIIVKSTNGA